MTFWLFQGVPNSIKTFLKSDIFYLPTDQETERADMIDKALAATRLFWPKVKNAMPLVVERLNEIYGVTWPELYMRYTGHAPRIDEKFLKSELSL